jgi:predicted nucleotidyltransferase
MDITAEQLSHIESIAARYGLDMVLLFGSAVTGKGEHRRSDVDIAVRHKHRAIGFKEYADLLHELQQLFPEKEIDLSLMNHADPLFLFKITENCRLLFGDPRQLLELKIYAYKRFQDHRRYFNLERAYVNRFLKETVPTA